jgi:hypothetical protein
MVTERTLYPSRPEHPIDSMLKVLVEPSDGLKERLLLRKLRWLLREICTHSKSMFDIGEEVHLVWYVHLLEDVFRLATLLGGEDVVSLYSRD